MNRKRFLIISIIGTLAFLLTVIGWFKVSAQEFGLTSGLICLGAACLYVFFFTELGLRFLKSPIQVTTNVRTLLVTCCLLLFVMELFLRFGTDQYTTYMEKAEGGSYHSINHHSGLSWFHLRTPLKDYTYKRVEFS